MDIAVHVQLLRKLDFQGIRKNSPNFEVEVNSYDHFEIERDPNRPPTGIFPLIRLPVNVARIEANPYY